MTSAETRQDTIWVMLLLSDKLQIDNFDTAPICIIGDNYKRK